MKVLFGRLSMLSLAALTDGNVNRKLGPGAEKQAPVQHHWLLRKQ